MLEQRLQQHFIDSADLFYKAAPQLGKPLSAAVQAMLAAITGGGKVLVWGDGAAAALAAYFAARLVSRFERERPGLAGLALGADATTRALLSETGDPGQTCARQVHALGQAGDILLSISAVAAGGVSLGAVQAAHDREMSVIALTAADGGELARQLRETDVHIAAPHEREPRVLEMHLLLLHCLLDSLDAQLLGDEEEMP